VIDDKYGIFCGMEIGRGNRITARRPAIVALCPPEIQHELTRD
jgi:hypothetical protein